MIIKEETLLKKKSSKIVNIQEFGEYIKYIIEDNKDKSKVNIYTCKNGNIVSVEDCYKDNIFSDEAIFRDSTKLLNRLSILAMIVLSGYIYYNKVNILILKPIQVALLAAIMATSVLAIVWNKRTKFENIRDLRFQIYMKMIFKSFFLILIIPAIIIGNISWMWLIAYIVVFYLYIANNIVSLAITLGLNE